MRISPTSTPVFTHRPYQGQGVSLYANAGTAVQYRRVRMLPGITGFPWLAGRAIIKVGTTIDWSGDTLPKSPRLFSAAGTAGASIAIEETLPAALVDEEIVLDVRHYRDDVEFEGAGDHQRLLVDAGGTGFATELGGSAEMLDAQPREGGIVRLRFRYFAPADGLATPDTFTITFTAGPTSPSPLEVTFVTGQSLYESDTIALADGTYTVNLTADSDTDSLPLVVDFQFTSDGSGPVAPLITSSEPV